MSFPHEEIDDWAQARFALQGRCSLLRGGRALVFKSGEGGGVPKREGDLE